MKLSFLILSLFVVSLQAQTALTYFGGPVMTGNNTVYLIWYGNWQTTMPGTIPIVENAFKNISNTPVLTPLTTYADSTGKTVKPSIIFGGSYFDSTESQSSSLGGIAFSTGVPRVVEYAITTLGAPRNTNAIYIIIGTADVTDSYAPNAYGWHQSYTDSSSNSIKYALVGRLRNSYVDPSPVLNGDAPSANIVSIAVHEMREAITDPTQAGWTGINGEADDLCQGGTGNTNASPNGAAYNIKLGAYYYFIAREWVNLGAKFGDAACYGALDPIPQPLISRYGRNSQMRGAVIVRGATAIR